MAVFVKCKRAVSFLAKLEQNANDVSDRAVVGVAVHLVRFSLQPTQLPVVGANPAVDIVQLGQSLWPLLRTDSCEDVLFAVVHVQSDFPVVPALVKSYRRQHTFVLVLACDCDTLVAVRELRKQDKLVRNCQGNYNLLE